MIILLISILAGFTLSVQDMISPIQSQVMSFLSLKDILPLLSCSSRLYRDSLKTFEKKFRKEIETLPPVSQYYLHCTRANNRDQVGRYELPGDLIKFVDEYFNKPDSFVCSGDYAGDPCHPTTKFIRYIINKIDRDYNRGWNTRMNKRMLISCMLMHISSPITYILEEYFGREYLQLVWNFCLFMFVECAFC